jgi:pimeloyl-ACP methyl ester carboxylesterase
MRQETAVDGFRLAYERTGTEPGRPAVLMLHGWSDRIGDFFAAARLTWLDGAGHDAARMG